MMKFRCEAVGLIINDRPVGAYFQDDLKAQQWAHETSNLHGCTVIIYQTYERVLKRVKPTKDRALKEGNGKPYGRVKGCYCGVRVFCPIHPEKGFQ